MRTILTLMVPSVLLLYSIRVQTPIFHFKVHLLGKGGKGSPQFRAIQGSPWAATER